MIETIEEQITGQKKLKILTVDDEHQSRYWLKKKLTKTFEGAEVIERDSPLHFFFDVTTEGPQVLIMDWRFPVLSCSLIMPELSQYKGLVCFYSNEDKRNIKKTIINCLGYLPSNFKIFKKQNYEEMKDEIIDYLVHNF